MSGAPWRHAAEPTRPAEVADRAPDAASVFRSTFDGSPTAVWQAPGRVNLIGEHTDYNDGFVLPLAIPARTEVAVRPRGDGRVRVRSRRTSELVEFPIEVAPGEVSGWPAYVAGVAWALAAAGHEVAGADLAIDSTVPAGAGLSSSAALEVAVLLALVGDEAVDRTWAASVARRAEAEFVGMPCGVMDQMVSLHGREDHLVFIDTRSLDVRPVALGHPADGEGPELVVIDSRAPHRLVAGEYAARRAQCHDAARALGVVALRDVDADAVASADLPEVLRRRARHVVTENARVLEVVSALRAGTPERIGPILDASHRSMRDDFENSVPEVDVVVEAAIAGGALGARMTGGGFGGCVVALVERGRADEIGRCVDDAARRAGHAPPRWFVARPGPGAGRVT